MRRWSVVLAVLVVGCTQASSQPVAGVTPSSPASPVTSASASAGGGTILPSPGPQAPSPIPDLPLTFQAFVCRLPISTPDSAQAGFLAVGTSDAVTFIPQAAGVHYYDRAFSKWLPVSREAVSPDGAHYAYTETQADSTSLLHLVDVASGTDHPYRVASSQSSQGFNVVFDYAAEGIYLGFAFERIWPGVWLFDPRNSSIRKVGDFAAPELSGGGGFWYGDVNPADPNPLLTGSSAGILSDEVRRYDLKTGGSTRWLYRPGDGLGVIGVDLSGRPLIISFAPKSHVDFKTSPIDDAATELLIGIDPSHQRSIYKGTLVESLGTPIADSHGVWFGSTRGIYLYSDANGLQKISNQPGFPANGCF